LLKNSQGEGKRDLAPREGRGRRKRIQNDRTWIKSKKLIILAGPAARKGEITDKKADQKKGKKTIPSAFLGGWVDPKFWKEKSEGKRGRLGKKPEVSLSSKKGQSKNPMTQEKKEGILCKGKKRH